ncbi:MAG: thioredoxin domain-containing protein [Actinomycetota bacterium]|nr:thioredoxin domain-containing protein [Actinomycetota bacterium]
MATGPQQKRKELREKRLKAEAAAKGGGNRDNLIKIVGAAIVAIIAIVIVIALVSGGGDDDKGSSGSSASVTEQLSGLEQNGTVLGDPKAKVTLVEFGDLQCPICKQYAEDVLPDVITGPIKAGDANFDFKNWAILGEGSILAAKAALAAAEQDRMWDFVEVFYAKQGPEGSGYVTDEFLTDVAEEAGVPDIDQWNADRESDKVEQALLDIDNEAVDQGFSGTPSFGVTGPDGEMTTVQANSTDPAENVQTIIDAINDAKGKS